MSNPFICSSFSHSCCEQTSDNFFYAAYISNFLFGFYKDMAFNSHESNYNFQHMKYFDVLGQRDLSVFLSSCIILASPCHDQVHFLSLPTERKKAPFLFHFKCVCLAVPYVKCREHHCLETLHVEIGLYVNSQDSIICSRRHSRFSIYDASFYV